MIVDVIFRALGRVAPASLLLSLASIGNAFAFDPAAATPGLYYIGSNVGEQIWAPLVLVRDGKLIDPVDEVREHGLSALEGPGKTTLLKATSFFLYGGCSTAAKLARSSPLLGGAPTLYVARFDMQACATYQGLLEDKWNDPTSADIDDSMPRLQLSPPYADLPGGLIWGVPGALVEFNRQVARMPLTEAAGRHAVVNGIVRSTRFVPLPVVHPDAAGLRAQMGGAFPASRHAKLSEIVHRKEIAVGERDLAEATVRIEPLMRERYLDRLEALAKPFGGVLRTSFLIQAAIGVDIENSGSKDLVGVARLQVDMRNGATRWIDAVWSLRTGGRSAQLDIVRSTDTIVLSDGSPYRSTRNPAPEPPTLVIAGIFDLDNDGRIELVTVQDAPVGQAIVHGPASLDTTIPVSRQDAVIHSWYADPGHWVDVFRGLPHEAGTAAIPSKNISQVIYGQ